MKTKLLLLFVAVCFALTGWGQISEYNNLGNTFEFGTGQDPEFVEFNGKMYFIGDFNNANNEFILSIDQNNQLNIEFDPTGGFLTDQYDIQALTVYNNQLYFALANLTTNPDSYFLYRLIGGIGELVSVSARVSDSYGGKMIVYNDVLYFAGRENGSVPEVGLISYSLSGGIAQVNTTVPGEDFLPSRFVVGANNTLYFFRQTDDFPFNKFGLYNLDTTSSSNQTPNIVTNRVWLGDGFNPPVVSNFGNKLAIIDNIANNGTGGVYLLSSNNVLSYITALVGVSSFSFKNQVNHNIGGIVYNNKLALFRAGNSTVNTTDFIDNRLVLLSDDESYVEYEMDNLDGGLDGAGFYGVENGALIFFAAGSSGEKIYELREITNNVLPTVRAILPFSTQDISPLFGKIFNNRLYYYGNPLEASDGSLRTLNYYDTSVLNYAPIVGTQEELEFFGDLGFRTVLQTLTIQNPSGGGTLVNDLSPLSSLEQVDNLQINFTGIVNLSGLENLEQVYRFFDLADNDLLTTLDGLNTNIVFDTQTPQIFQNDILTNFCALQTWAAAADEAEFSSDWIPTDNGYNPTWAELQSSTSCTFTLNINDDGVPNEEENIAVYPNPVVDGLYVKLKSNSDELVINLYDELGRKVYSSPIWANEFVLLPRLESGIYFLKINFKNGEFITKRIVVKQGT